MAELMLNADLAVGAGGSATWERCCLGLPAIVFTVAENQRQLVEDAALAGIVYAPDVQATDPAAIALHVRAVMSNPRLLAAISKRGMEMVDGNGAQRVMHAMDVSAVTIRRAADTDIQSMFEWRNAPEIRAHSRSKSPIDWQAHRAWAEAVLSDSGKMLLIGEHAGRPVGVVRFDVAATQAEVSIYTIPGSGGQGLGSDLLHAAERWLLRDAAQVTHVSAEVLDDNEPSHRLFRRAGYARESTRYRKRLNR
jgi:RimJ/RimL family protein N-acetyltransferase